MLGVTADAPGSMSDCALGRWHPTAMSTRQHGVQVAFAALFTLLASARVVADEPSTFLELVMTGGGFQMRSTEPALIARCAALGSTLRVWGNQVMHCPLAATSTRPDVRISLSPLPGQSTLGQVSVSATFRSPRAALVAFDAARPPLTARFGTAVDDAVPDPCDPGAREACVADESFSSITSTWTIPPPSPRQRARPSAAHPEVATLESVELQLQKTMDRDEWIVSVTRYARGFQEAFSDAASN